VISNTRIRLGIALAATLALTGCGGSSSGTLPPNITVSVAPKLAAVAATSQTQQFTATVTGGSNPAVTWSVDGATGGDATVGTISTNGLYTPPATAGAHTVTATSVANSAASASASIAVTDLAGVFTYHNDLLRDGANAQEYGLTPSSVNTNTFGKLFSCPVDGAVYTQPLWVPGVSIGGALHNVIYVATQHDSVFAFDADASPCVQLWQVNLLDTLHGGTAGETPVVWNDVGNLLANCFGDIYPEVGVTGTPVIDPATGTIYLVNASEIPGAGSGNCSLPPLTFFHRLHALDITSGSEKFNAPVTINSQIPQYFSGTGSFWGTAAFWQNNLYFAGNGDVLKQFSFDPTTGLFCSPQPCTPSPASHSSQSYGYPDASPSVSSQGSKNGIVWAIDASLYGYASPNVPITVNCSQVPVPAACTGPAILHAYDAQNLATEYWNSTMAAGNRDQAGNAVKFVPPTVANGKVYVSTRTEIDVYGLIP
jgi:hypothetical protein